MISESATLATAGTYQPFWDPTEFNPHGSAHMSFGGDLSNPGTAPRDPLFFLLHCNVDRLWAKWQLQNRRFNASSQSVYAPKARANRTTALAGSATASRTRCGPGTASSVACGPRALPAPRFPTRRAPRPRATTPRVRSMIDWQGHADGSTRLGFDYDDVKYEPGP